MAGKLSVLQIFIAMCFVLCIKTPELCAQQSLDDWQKKAVSEYPDLAIKGSSLNARFLQRVELLKRTNPSYFHDPQWPYLIAKDVAAPPIIPGLENITLPVAKGSPSPTLSQPVKPTPIPIPAGTPSGGVALERGWDNVLQGGTATMKDLDKLLSPYVHPSNDTSANNPIPIYQGVKYLMPIDDARGTLGLKDKLASKNMVTCPGFPKDSCFYYSIDGEFEDGYEEISIVVDKKDQVICVQLSTKHPKGSVSNDDSDLFTYNFVNARSKALSTMTIGYDVSSCYSYGRVKRWLSARPEFATRIFRQLDENSLRVDTCLFGKGASAQHHTESSKPLEAARLYIPKPLIQIILFNVEKSLHSS